MTHDTRHLDGKEKEYRQFFAEELEISFYFPITPERFPESSEYTVYQKQRSLIDHLCDADEGKESKALVPVDISRSGVTFIAQFNPVMEEHLMSLRWALSIIADLDIEEVEVDFMYTDEEVLWVSVIVDSVEDRTYRTLTDEELAMRYVPEDTAGVEYY